MADDQAPQGERKSAALRLAEEAKRRPIAAALVGGAAAAGAYMGARAIARRAADGKPINQVLKTAITASECARASKKGGDGGA